VEVAAIFGLWLIFFLLARSLQGFDVFGIGNRTGDDVPAASPLAEVDEAATVTAERELGLLTQHDFTARRTTKTDGFLSGHNSFYRVKRRSGDQNQRTSCSG
jgi:hypothetical protein